MSGIALSGAGRCCYLGGIAVTCCIFIGILIAVTAGAGMQGVALIGTGRCYDLCGIAVLMGGLGDSCGLFCSAYGTGMLLSTC